MKILYNIYQICFALPVLLVLTVFTALVTIIGSLLGGAHFWGYYPGKIWSQLICYLLLIPVKINGREKLHKRTSYVFVPNHQGSFDIFLIYGFLGRNFKWMMKICPALSHALPTNGILRRLFFIIHLKVRPRNPYIRNMSKAPW